MTDTHEQALITAHEQAKKALGEKVTTETIKSVQAAEKALTEYRARSISGKANESFEKKTQVLEYLQEEGWDIKKSKLFTDLKSVPRTKGCYLKKDVDMYAKLRLVKADGPERENDSAEKTRQEIRVASARAEKLEMENEILQGKYILRSEVEQLHASKAHHLKSGLIGFFQSQTSVMVELCDGDQDKAAELREYCMRELRKHLNEYSKSCRYSVPAVLPVEDGED